MHNNVKSYRMSIVPLLYRYVFCHRCWGTYRIALEVVEFLRRAKSGFGCKVWQFTKGPAFIENFFCKNRHHNTCHYSKVQHNSLTFDNSFGAQLTKTASAVYRFCIDIHGRIIYTYFGVISVPDGPFLASWDRPNTTKYPKYQWRSRVSLLSSISLSELQYWEKVS